METSVTLKQTDKIIRGLQATNHRAVREGWQGSLDMVVFEEEAVRAELLDLNETLYVIRVDGKVGVTRTGEVVARPAGHADLLAILPALPPEQLGDHTFNACYGTRYAYYAGAMASAIASVPMVIALGQAGFLGSFGAAGLPPARLEAAIQQVQAALPYGPYAFNLIHSPSEEALERRAVELYLRYNVRVVEASAFLDLTPHIVYYRAAGLSVDRSGAIQVKNKVIAKISRREVAAKFMQPAPSAILDALVKEGKITPEQAALAQKVPMADDITVE